VVEGTVRIYIRGPRQAYNIPKSNIRDPVKQSLNYLWEPEFKWTLDRLTEERPRRDA